MYIVALDQKKVILLLMLLGISLYLNEDINPRGSDSVSSVGVSVRTFSRGSVLSKLSKLSRHTNIAFSVICYSERRTLGLM